ncbi:MAG: acyltransferase [Candidatus Ancillula sp.]|nr:acyltransferase [Candidatus Ancillula sp.]
MKSHIKFLDTLRVLGLVFVLLYHFFRTSQSEIFGFQLFQGGFVGVDIFFLLSGFLITINLLNQSIKQKFSDMFLQTFSFLKKRFFRIYPSLIAMLLIILPFVLLISPDFRINFAKEVAAILGSCFNFYQIYIGQSYDHQSLPDLFTHLWTLSLEFQFYIFWALVFLLFNFLFHFFSSRIKTGQKRRLFSNSVFRIRSLIIGFFSFIFLVTSSIIMFHTFSLNQAYFSSLSHSYPLFFGSFIACVYNLNLLQPINIAKVSDKVNRLILGFFGVLPFLLLLIFLFLLKFDSIFTFKGGLLLSTTAGSLLLVFSLLYQNIKFDDSKIIKYFSSRSYLIYLFHYPLLIIFSNCTQFNYFFACLVTLVLSLFFSEILYRLFHLKTNPVLNFAIIIISFALVIKSISIFTTAPSRTSLDRNLSLQQVELSANQFNQYTNSLNSNKNILLIGDSVSLAASSELQKQIPNLSINADIGRQFSTGVNLLSDMARAKTLPNIIIFELGTNGTISPKDMNQLIHLTQDRILILVNVFADRSWTSADNDIIKNTVNNNDNILLVDWSSAIANHVDLLASDKIHPITLQAREIYTKLIHNAINIAKTKSNKLLLEKK